MHLLHDECHACFHLYWSSWADRNTEQANITKWKKYCPQFASNPAARAYEPTALSK